MSRVRTQEDFLQKAHEVHDDTYDYSQVKYAKSSVPVTIICKIHGPFRQSPNKHLVGQGCKQCGRQRTKVGRDEFIRRAQAVHGLRYDYSRVVYERKDKPVEIICAEHGSFFQTPHSHVTLAQNCPKCAAAEGGRKRSGDANCQHRPEVRAKTQQTCLSKYGAKTYAESAEGRQKLREIVTAPEVAAKMQATCMDRYGAKTWPESQAGRQQLHIVMGSDAVVERIRSGYRAAYGVDHFMQTERGRELARQHIMQPERREAIRQAFLTKYGVENALLIADVHVKGWATKRANGTFNTSKPEETLYGLLCDKFGRAHVERQYSQDPRYPFHCDFYIQGFDLFIELNANWTHGGHWFDEDNPLDVEKLAYWQYRCEHIGSQFYKEAIQTWTVRDVRKCEHARMYDLNYLVFWDNDLSDARAWLASL